MLGPGRGSSLLLYDEFWDWSEWNVFWSGQNLLGCLMHPALSHDLCLAGIFAYDAKACVAFLQGALACVPRRAHGEIIEEVLVNEVQFPTGEHRQRTANPLIRYDLILLFVYCAQHLRNV